MVTNNALNIPTATAGKVLQGGGIGANYAFSTATYPATAGTSGNVLTSDGTNWNSAAPSGGGGSAGASYGNGQDGTVTFDGSSVVLGLTPSSSVYTLNRDIFLAAGTINNGVSIKTNGFRVFCKGALTNNGTILWNGTNASGTTKGFGPSNSSSTFQVNTAATTAPGTEGGPGATNGGTGGSASVNHAYGGQGGTGGTGVGGAGAAGGTKASLATGYSPIYAMPYCTMLREFKGDGTNTYIQAGTGGGSGGGNTFGDSSGAGGGGGGIVFVAAFTFSGTGTIQAKGGNGGDGSTAGGESFYTGGGGGGGGGLLVIISSSISGGAISGQTLDVSGGAGGLKGGSSGTNGAAGSTGNTILLNG